MSKNIQRKFINLLGHRFGRLIVIEKLPNNKHNQIMWKCKCDCGNEVITTTSSLRTKNTRSCGCFHKEKVSSMMSIDFEIGQKINRWTILRKTDMKKGSHNVWEVQCECGTIKFVTAQTLNNGTSKSCGCLKDELSSKRSTVHGFHGTSIYQTWHNMKQRCYNSNASGYKDYGGRGIRVCNDWLDAHAFIEWALTNFDINEDCLDYNGVKLSIERNDVNGNYEPDNCTWIPLTHQVWNRRCTVRIDGITVREYAQLHGLRDSTVYDLVAAKKLVIDDPFYCNQ